MVLQVEEYEYDEAMEPHYRASQFKLFNKTLDDGFFPMIVVDAINHKVQGSFKYFNCSSFSGGFFQLFAQGGASMYPCAKHAPLPPKKNPVVSFLLLLEVRLLSCNTCTYLVYIDHLIIMLPHSFGC